MSLREDIIPYIDKNDMVAPNLEQVSIGSDNGVLFTSHYLMLLNQQGQLSLKDEIQFERLVERCYIVQGLLSRAPGNLDQDSPDNMVGACSISRKVAFDVYTYGKSNGWVYNQENPGTFTIRAFLGRQVGLMGWLRYRATGEAPNLLHILFLWVGAYLTLKLPENDVSDRILLVRIMEGLPNKGLLKLLKSYCNKKLEAMGGLKQCFLIYFGKNHPLYKYCP